MENWKIRNFYAGKENVPCPLTDDLISHGYRQKSGGYIKYAKECKVDNPTQYWHLIESWSKRRKDDAQYNKRIQCGELIFWMAEVSNAVDYDELNRLKNWIFDNCLNEGKMKNRREGNKKIKEECFDKIINVIQQFNENN